ncbi:phytanoyl-CoA dioxygenase family protein [Mucilaginibacter sp. HMF5004]|uniref:phytanoyl-CoA dioxygenase family protein n=1 Tax=Mucilaginibacter rivuli TaxID=2857527 RepID=UPI001C5FCFA3|nr:phytanoyl-CoA dioxygenase family protein [Mucilaginibacter rivuli]MBW4889987.1 phytanoyl-CoA dioxygenase family protein [Mucilaginibacter rivuli]
MQANTIPSSHETGKLQVKHLKRYWTKALLKRDSKLGFDELMDEWTTDTTLLNILGIGLEQTTKYVFQNSPAFDEFEDWIITVTGGPDSEKINRFNQLFEVGDRPHAPIEKVLNEEDLAFWEENGYLIIRNAVSKENCDKAIEALCHHIGIERHNSATWYSHLIDKQGIMVQLFQHPALEHNRQADTIRKVYEQLWNRTDIWPTTDRVSFNPPETVAYPFQGPRLHWDTETVLPIPFGLQGLLYLSDTAENQGAFTLVPGFQHRITSWINSLPAGAVPGAQDLYALGPKPIAANAGDFIVWHHALPHGSSPNTSALPRFVQYINYTPADGKQGNVWS